VRVTFRWPAALGGKEVYISGAPAARPLGGPGPRALATRYWARERCRVSANRR
jgi:hypothetical protein